MVFLTELGDLERFPNRRQLAAYLGLAPAAFESGERDDRKGRITRQGPSRVRHVLCQAAWAAMRCSAAWRAKYDRIKGGKKGRSKVAIVALMRQLAVTMWHAARSPEWDELLDEMDTAAIARETRGTEKKAVEPREVETKTVEEQAEAQRNPGRKTGKNDARKNDVGKASARQTTARKKAGGRIETGAVSTRTPSRSAGRHRSTAPGFRTE